MHSRIAFPECFFGFQKRCLGKAFPEATSTFQNRLFEMDLLPKKLFQKTFYLEWSFLNKKKPFWKACFRNMSTMWLGSVEMYLAWRVGGGDGLLHWTFGVESWKKTWVGEKKLVRKNRRRREELESRVHYGKKRRMNGRMHNCCGRKKRKKGEKIERVGWGFFKKWEV